MRPSRRPPAARIQKLLALAADQRGTPEGEAAERMARVLIRRHAVDLQGLDAASRELLDPVESKTLELGGAAPWRRRLSATVAAHCACRVAWPRDRPEMCIFGHREDLEIAEYLWVVLSREVEGARLRWLVAQGGDPEEDAELRQGLRDFCHSAVTAIDGRLRQLREVDDEADPTGTALVIAREDDVRDWLDRQGYRFVRAPPSPHGHSPEGWAAGHRVAIMDAVRWEEVRRGAFPHS